MALCVVEIENRTGIEFTQPGDHFVVRHLERLPMRSTYPQVAERLRELVQSLWQRGETSPHVYIDATGLGRPVVEILSRGLIYCWFWSVYFNHGDQWSQDGSTIRLGKAWLVARLKVLLQLGELHLPRQSAEADTLARELTDYEVKVLPDANERPGAFRVGTSDDMVTALGMAVQLVPSGWATR